MVLYPFPRCHPAPQPQRALHACPAELGTETCETPELQVLPHPECHSLKTPRSRAPMCWSCPPGPQQDTVRPQSGHSSGPCLFLCPSLVYPAPGLRSPDLTSSCFLTSASGNHLAPHVTPGLTPACSPTSAPGNPSGLAVKPGVPLVCPPSPTTDTAGSNH